MDKNKTLLIVAAAVIVIIIAYFAWMNRAEAPDLNENTSQDEQAGIMASDAQINAAWNGLIGTWVSLDDERFKRQFTQDGNVQDSYDGDPQATTVSTWSVFNKQNPDSEFTGAYEDGAVYLKFNTGPDSIYFKLTKVTPDNLEMIHLDRGNLLRFERFIGTK